MLRERFSLNQRRAQREVGENAGQAGEDDRHSGEPEVARNEQVREQDRYQRLCALSEDDCEQLPAKPARHFGTKPDGVQLSVNCLRGEAAYAAAPGAVMLDERIVVDAFVSAHESARDRSFVRPLQLLLH